MKKKLFFSVLAILVLGVVALTNQVIVQNEKVEIGEVELTKNQYKEINELFKDSHVGYKVCNLKNKDCVLLLNVENTKEVKEGAK